MTVAQHRVGHVVLHHVFDLAAGVELAGGLAVELVDAEHAHGFGPNVQLAAGVGLLHAQQAHFGAQLAQRIVEVGRNAEGGILLDALAHQLPVAGLEDVQVQLFAGKNDQIERKQRQQAGHEKRNGEVDGNTANKRRRPLGLGCGPNAARALKPAAR